MLTKPCSVLPTWQRGSLVLSRETISSNKKYALPQVPLTCLPTLGLQSVYCYHLEPVPASPLWRSRGWWDNLLLPVSFSPLNCLSFLLNPTEFDLYPKLKGISSFYLNASGCFINHLRTYFHCSCTLDLGTLWQLSLSLIACLTFDSEMWAFCPRYRLGKARRNETGGEALSAVW